MTRNRVWTGAILLLGILSAAPARSQVYLRGDGLPLILANQAANAALAYCAKKGFPVSVTVVDPAGEVRVFLKSDHATVHTKDASFMKAYTIITFGPIFNLDRSSLVAEKFRSNVNGSAFATISNILPLPGGVTIRNGSEIVGAIGVSGSPDGMDDETCGLAGVAAISSKL